MTDSWCQMNEKRFPCLPWRRCSAPRHQLCSWAFPRGAEQESPLLEQRWDIALLSCKPETFKSNDLKAKGREK